MCRHCGIQVVTLGFLRDVNSHYYLIVYTLHVIPDINKYIINLYNLIANLESPYTSYSRFQFSKHLHLL